MKRLSILIIMLLLFVCNANSQEHSNKKNINEISKIYSKKLGLTKSQSKKFKYFLLKYNKELEGVEDKRLFNQIVKKQTLEISKLISIEQYAKFKKIVLEIESYKKYKL